MAVETAGSVVGGASGVGIGPGFEGSVGVGIITVGKGGIVGIVKVGGIVGNPGGRVSGGG